MSARCILLTTPGQQLFPTGRSALRGVSRRGPGRIVAPGALPDPFSLTDLAPTLLWLLGLPASTEMPGRTHVEILDPAGQNVLGEPRAIASYGRLEADVEDPGSQELDAPMLELLRSLGYIDR
ncbi:MAG: hypothetical protein R3E12_11755 [Candidatus Eisenbacteria bacterium]